MADFDVILSPSAPGAAPKGLASTGTSTFNRLWTLMGTPCVNVPGLADPNGLPLGVQVIGRFGGDRATLEAALFVESALTRRRLGWTVISHVQRLQLPKICAYACSCTQAGYATAVKRHFINHYNGLSANGATRDGLALQYVCHFGPVVRVC